MYSSIKVKTKKCTSCGEIKKIYSRGLCAFCYKQEQNDKQIEKSKQKNRKAYSIPKFSKNMIKKLSLYRPLRDKYMEEHKICEFKGCNKPSDDLHHKRGRGPYLSDVSTFMAVCRKHHNWIDNNDSEAREMGYLLSRIANKNE